MSRGLFIGRFQPYHLGHHQAILKLSSELDELIIAIGSAQHSHQLQNPFTAGERMYMISSALKGKLTNPCYLIPVMDVNRNSIWVAHLRSLCPPFERVYSCNPLVLRLFREAGIQAMEHELIQPKLYSGTEIRRRMIADEPWEHLVPPEVAQVIKQIGGVERLKCISGRI